MLDHRDALRADFQRFYRLDFRLFENGLMQPTYAADLAAYLPENAAIWRKIDKRATWDTTQQLLANIADSTAFLAWAETSQASHKGAKWRGALQRPGFEKTRKAIKGQAFTSPQAFEERFKQAQQKYKK